MFKWFWTIFSLSDRRVLLQNQVVGLRNSLVTFCHQSPSKFFTPSSGFYPNCFKPRSNRNQKLMSKAMGGITEVKPGRKSDKWQACQNMNMCEKLQLTNQTKQWWKGELYEDYSFIQLNLPKRITKCRLLWFWSCLGLSPMKFRNIFRYKQVERSCNVSKECFWEHGNWFFQFRVSSGARLPLGQLK